MLLEIDEPESERLAGRCLDFAALDAFAHRFEDPRLCSNVVGTDSEVALDLLGRDSLVYAVVDGEEKVMNE